MPPRRTLLDDNSTTVTAFPRNPSKQPSSSSEASSPDQTYNSDQNNTFVYDSDSESNNISQGSSSGHPEAASTLENSESQDSHRENLSDAEKIRLIPLQYVDSKEKFLCYLKDKHNFSTGPHGELSDEKFKRILFDLRKISLDTLNNPLSENTEIFDLNFKNWLEKKLELFNGAPISLKLDPEHQKNLDKQFNSEFPLTSLPGVTITNKSVEQLNEELKVLGFLNKALADKLYEAFSKIQVSFAGYPRLNYQESETSQAPLQKRECNTCIQWLYAVTEKLNSFEEEINNRIAKIENMIHLKSVAANQADTTTDAQTPGAVYLPHSCSIIPNSDELNSSADFSVKSDAFYQQNPPKLNQTLTFEHTLSTNEKRI